MKRTKKAPRQDVYERVTNRIIEQLEHGVIPWVQPWDGRQAINASGVAVTLPENGHTGNRYSGINILLLWGAAMMGGHKVNRWVTFKQAQALGGTVMKGEKSTQIVYADRFVPKEERERARDSGDDPRSIGFLKTYNVFNVSQCDGLPVELLETSAPLPEREEIAHMEAFIDATGADFRIGGERAFYNVTDDFIQVPPQPAFRDQINYYRTSMHELGHWSGAKHRCNRDMTGRRGSSAYAFEELVAELTSAFTCAAQGVTPTVHHADYIGSWLRVLKDDKRAVFRAARLASEACDFLHGFLAHSENSQGAA